jgi:hypothetical protein
MKKVLIVGASFLLPLAAFAQLTNLETNIVTPIGRIINLLIPIVFALALLYFFWGLAQYILSSGDPAKQEEGKNKMIWGIVALFVMAAVWGLVRFLGEAIGITQSPGPTVNPLIPKP